MSVLILICRLNIIVTTGFFNRSWHADSKMYMEMQMQSPWSIQKQSWKRTELECLYYLTDCKSAIIKPAWYLYKDKFMIQWTGLEPRNWPNFCDHLIFNRGARAVQQEKGKPLKQIVLDDSKWYPYQTKLNLDPTILVSWGCHNKVPQTGWLKTECVCGALLPLKPVG